MVNFIVNLKENIKIFLNQIVVNFINFKIKFGCTSTTLKKQEVDFFWIHYKV